MFGRKKTSVALSHSKTFALNAGLAMLEAIVEDKIVPRDYALLQTPFMTLADGGSSYTTRIAGHFQRKGNLSSISFVVTVSTRNYIDKEPEMEFDFIHEVTIDDNHDYYKYRVEWQSASQFRYQRWENGSLTGGWHSSEEGKDIGEFESQLGLTTVGFLYCCRIRTLRHLLQWSKTQLVRNGGLEQNMVESLSENLEGMGFALRPE